MYWIPLFEELERQGFECLLISSRSLRRVSGQEERYSRCTMDPDPAQLWIAGKFVSTAGRLGGAADIAAASRAIAGTSSTAYSAYAEGIVANERAVVTSLERCDGRNGTDHYPRDRGRRT